MTRARESRSILLVEDNPMDVDLTLRAFKRQKLSNTIQVARDGEEALQWIERWESGAPLPLLILLDLKLPRVDGLDVLRAIKGHPSLRAIPVVVLTTSADDGDVRTAYQLGANSYIIKPVEFEAFLRVTEQLNLYWMLLNHLP